MAEIMLKGYRCERCNHEWVPRDKDYPRVCPKCKSPYWDTERTLPTGKNLKKRSKQK